MTADAPVPGNRGERRPAAPAAQPPRDAEAAARRAAVHAAVVLDRELLARSRPALGARLRRALTRQRTCRCLLA